MAVTLLDQETQIRNTSPVSLYDDTVAATVANFETNPVSLKDDLNNLRSQVHNLLKNQAGNWYDDLNTPSALDTGTQRGVNDLNSDLHSLERKRVLVEVFNPTDVTPGIEAIGTLTGTANFANGETVTTGSKTYTFQTALTNVDGNVLIGASLADSLSNLNAAIGLGAGSGTLYATATTANTFVYSTSTATTLDLIAKVGGAAGNSIATTETATNASFGAATLTGGADTSISVLSRTSELPGNTTLAIGVVTTRGTVAAAHGGTFGTTHSLTVVAGSTATSPKNLVPIVDATTHDPILSSGRRIYALFQSESSTDGSTATLVTTNRVQLSYVRMNAGGTALELVPFSDFASYPQIHYSAIERKALEDFNEQDFLKGSSLDVPSSTTVTRQVAYDNQGTTPVDLLTNATLDLEGAGLIWAIRDDAQANLLRIIEGSAGGTSEVEIGSDVDLYDNNAVDNDFLNGIKVDTGSAGTTINVGVTANQIDAGGVLKVASGGGANLNLEAALELNLTDSYRAGSTWSLADGIALADSSAEWSSFETAFGEVSLLNAIVQAKNSSSHRKVYATVTADINADVDLSFGDGNLDVTLGDLSAGSFLTDYDIFHNGSHQYNGANAAANKDVYPGTSLAAGQLKFEKKLKTGDIIIVVDRAFGP